MKEASDDLVRKLTKLAKGGIAETDAPGTRSALMRVAKAFSQLQELRELADYATSETFDIELARTPTIRSPYGTMSRTSPALTTISTRSCSKIDPETLVI
jgi:hypothetical protein